MSSGAMTNDRPNEADLLGAIADRAARCPATDAGRRELIDLVRREVKRLPPRLRESVSTYFGFDGRERIGRTDMDALNRGLTKLRTRIRIDPVQLSTALPAPV